MKTVSPYGSFQRLPAELRLAIWEYALSNGSTAIMRTSRAFYEDISDRLYDTIQYHLYPRYDDPWIRVSSRRLRVSWTVERRENCFWGGLWDLPYNKTNLSIRIYAPDPKEKAQLIQLWLKVYAVVAILQQQAENARSIEISLCPFNGHDWQRGVQSFKYLRGSCPDHDAIQIPLHKLSQERNVLFPPGYPGTPFASRADLNAAIADHDFLYDAELDTLPGHTAAMLRLERFGTWFSKPLGKILYEGDVLAAIRRYPKTIARHDPDLKKLRLRYNYFDTCGYFVTRDRLGYPEFHDVAWDKWLDAYPLGVPEFSEEHLREERKLAWTRFHVYYPPFGELRPRFKPSFWENLEALCGDDYEDSSDESVGGSDDEVHDDSVVEKCFDTDSEGSYRDV